MSTPGPRTGGPNLLLALVFQVILALPSLALDPDRTLLQYNCRTWTRQNGLPVNSVHALEQTADGYLWLGSTGGLVRFDGIGFKRFELSAAGKGGSSAVRDLISGKDGGLWVALDNQIGFHNGTYLSFGAKQKFEPDTFIRSMFYGEDEALWVVADQEIFRLDHQGTNQRMWKAPVDTPYISVTSGFRDSKGRRWFGTAQRGLYHSQDGERTKLKDPALDAGIIWAITEDKNGNLWVGTSGGLFCFDPALKRRAIPPLSIEVRAILEDRSGSVWIGTSGSGVLRYREGEPYQDLIKNDGLAHDYVESFLEDREGSLWVGTRDGLSQLTDVRFKTQPATEYEGVQEALCVAASRKGGIWVGSSAGITYFDGKAKTYGFESGLRNTYVKRIFEASNGDIYLADGDGQLVILSDGKVVAVHKAAAWVVGIAEDSHGVVVSSGSSLLRASREGLLPYQFDGGKDPELHWVSYLGQGRGDSILVASHNGIFRLKGGTYQQWSTAEGMADRRTEWVYEDAEGTLWASQRTGIVRIGGGRVCSIGTRDGLFDDDVYTVIPDGAGRLWGDSARGIFSVTLASIEAFAAGTADRVQCTGFDDSQSVKSSDKTNQERVACVTPNEHIWFPNSNGVLEIDPTNIARNTVQPPVHIDQVRINGKDPRRKDSVVPPGKGELEVEFTALSFISPHDMSFRYKLEGYDKDWVDAEDRRMAFYTNLKPGKYLFRVIAANGDGVWNRIGAVANVEIPSHFYETTWFYLLVGGLACSGAAGVYGMRVRQVGRKHRLLQQARDHLETEVRNRTSELAQANASLQQEVQDHKRTGIQLQHETRLLENEIAERERMQFEIERVHRELVDASRLAGMAEVATSVLHNVGNVLNSVSVSAEVVGGKVNRFKTNNLVKVAELLRENASDLPAFLSSDPRGRALPEYLLKLVEQMSEPQKEIFNELESLRKNIGHIKEIVAMQQTFARGTGVMEEVAVPELLEDAIRINAAGFSRHELFLIRDYAEMPPIVTDRHKVLQILVNLLGNAKHAVSQMESGKRITVRAGAEEGEFIKIEVSDNGVGIPSENLTRIFQHGFTTKADGHGFGLHSGALAAGQLGGSLTAHSDGVGKGASFVLLLPVQPNLPS